MIRCIHQTWKDTQPPDPPFRSAWRESWTDQNPGWSHRLWTDEDIEAFVAREYPGFYPLWCAYPKAIMRVDAWRYLLLMKEGGLYVDLDFACLRPLDQWLPDEGRVALADQGDGQWCNAFLWAPEPSLPFFDQIVTGLAARASLRDVIEATGPGFLSRYGKARPDLVHLLPTARIYPLPYWAHDRCRMARGRSAPELLREFPDACAITFWSHSWKGQSDTTPGGVMDSVTGVLKQGELDAILVAVVSPDSDGGMAEAGADTWRSHCPQGIDVRSFSGPWSRIAAELLSSALEEVGWIFVCLPGTYVALDRLPDLIPQGSDLVGNEELVSRGRPGAAAGYLVSRSAVEKLAACANAKWPELPPTADLMGELGLTWVATHRLRADASRVPSRRNGIVTAFGPEPLWMRLIHTLLNAEPLRVSPAGHADWQEDLAFYENGLFARGEGNACGWWEPEASGNIALRWFDRREEVFVPMRDDRGEFTGSGLVVSRRAADHACRPSRPEAGDSAAYRAGF